MQLERSEWGRPSTSEDAQQKSKVSLIQPSKQSLTEIFREKAVPQIEEEMKQQLREYVIKEQGHDKRTKLVELPVHKLSKCPVQGQPSDAEAFVDPKYCYVRN